MAGRAHLDLPAFNFALNFLGSWDCIGSHEVLNPALAFGGLLQESEVSVRQQGLRLFCVLSSSYPELLLHKVEKNRNLSGWESKQTTLGHRVPPELVNQKKVVG